MTDTPLCVADVLERAADLIEPEGKWTQQIYARTEDGRSTDVQDPEAICFCMAGALARVAGDFNERFISAKQVVGNILDRGMADWNDAPERTQPEVVAALRRAATLARAGDA